MGESKTKMAEGEFTPELIEEMKSKTGIKLITHFFTFRAFGVVSLTLMSWNILPVSQALPALSPLCFDDDVILSL